MSNSEVHLFIYLFIFVGGNFMFSKPIFVWEVLNIYIFALRHLTFNLRIGLNWI